MNKVNNLPNLNEWGIFLSMVMGFGLVLINASIQSVLFTTGVMLMFTIFVAVERLGGNGEEKSDE